MVSFKHDHQIDEYIYLFINFHKYINWSKLMLMDGMARTWTTKCMLVDGMSR